MPDPYATEADLAEFLAGSGYTAPAGTAATRLLARASELLDDVVTRPYPVAAVTGLPTEADVAAAMSDAACAQVEFWLEVGDDHDVTGLANRQTSIGHLTLTMPPELAPRAARILRGAGMMAPTDVDTTAGAFFATQDGTP